MKKHFIQASAAPLQSGFSMIEILIAIVVLSFGLLGLAGLQLQGIKNNHSAHTRSQAVDLAYDILDRMRANRAAALNGEYTIAFDTSITGTPTSVPDQDLAAWKTALSSKLPSGNGAITTAAQNVTVSVSWNDSRATGGNSAMTFVVRSRL
jgi:type IV pilus assembly protein PilV